MIKRIYISIYVLAMVFSIMYVGRVFGEILYLTAIDTAIIESWNNGLYITILWIKHILKENCYLLKNDKTKYTFKASEINVIWILGKTIMITGIMKTLASPNWLI